MKILQNINCHEDLLKLNDEDRLLLCQEIRDFLIQSVSRTGGHLASNLGVVELSVALETVYDTSVDRLVFDVGHQAYVHKLLTGRRADFDHLRQFGGMAGFPKPCESGSDAFVAGHASSSVSIALGMAKARTLQKQDYDVVALIGDGAATGGLAYEGLNNAAYSREPMVVILNDNAMSIDRNVGGMATHLSRLRTKEQYLGFKEDVREISRKIPGGKQVYNAMRNVKDWVKRSVLPTTIFENMGFTYLGPVDGNDVNGLVKLLKAAKEMGEPVLIHVMTHKGHGYVPAEVDPARFHGIGKFDPETGASLGGKKMTFSDAFGEVMLELAEEEPNLCAITAAMPGGTGLMRFKQQYPERTFDVGIAEEHAVSMAGGLAKQGMVPVTAIYSTFLQRSYDQIMQDIALLGLHAVFAVDRAGLVGEDGETHHGTFDVGFLRQVPGMTILCPASCAELKDMMRWAVKDHNGPVAVRYPRGGDRDYKESSWYEGAVKCHRQGSDVTIVTYGTLIQNAMDGAGELASRGIDAGVVRLLRVDPLPVEELIPHICGSRRVVIMEETNTGSGIREALAWALHGLDPNCRVYGMDLGSRFVTHGDLNALYRACGLDGRSAADFIEEAIRNEK